MQRILYFSYGSNMNLKQMRERCPEHKKIGIGYMPDAEICFPSFYESWNGGVAGYKNSPGSKMWGVLFELSQSDLDNLRVFEGYVHGREAHLNAYNEVVIDVHHETEKVQCMTYEVLVTGNFRPSLRYLQTIIQGAEDNNLPEEYIAGLSQHL